MLTLLSGVGRKTSRSDRVGEKVHPTRTLIYTGTSAFGPVSPSSGAHDIGANRDKTAGRVRPCSGFKHRSMLVMTRRNLFKSSHSAVTDPQELAVPRPSHDHPHCRETGDEVVPFDLPQMDSRWLSSPVEAGRVLHHAAGHEEIRVPKTNAETGEERSSQD